MGWETGRTGQPRARGDWAWPSCPQKARAYTPGPAGLPGCSLRVGRAGAPSLRKERVWEEDPPLTEGASDCKQHAGAHTWEQGREEGAGRGKGGASGLVTLTLQGEGRGCCLRGPTWSNVSSPSQVHWGPRLWPPGPPSHGRRSGPGAPACPPVLMLGKLF